MTGYVGSDTWHYDIADAVANFRVVLDEWSGGSDSPLVSYLEAEAGTGSRYCVVATELPSKAAYQALGAPGVVSLLSPWQAAYPMHFAAGGALDWTYVLEKLCPVRSMPIHGGDLAAITLTVGRALNRPVSLPERSNA